jgi:transcription elongation factor GreA
MNDKDNFVTKEGLKKLEEELQELTTTKRKEIAERISEAKELGDLSENAEYIEAKEEQGFVETRILELKEIVKNSKIIKHKKNTETVQVGSTVTVKVNGTEMTYTIVGSSEANPSEQLISNASPIGEGVLGQSVGETVLVEAPGGQMTIDIISVE